MPERAENFVTKLDEVRKLIVMRLPSIDVQNLAEIMSKLAQEGREFSYIFSVKRTFNAYKTLI